MTPSPAPTLRERLWPMHVLILVLVLGALYPLCIAEFSWWDDQITIHQNPRINTPTFENVAYYWTHFKDGLYVPVTYTLWAALAKLAFIGDPGEDGIFLNSWFFHSTNVAIHLTSTLLVFGILRRLLHRTDAALVGALVFGLHPVQVETVGWASGTKDVLCWCFALATMLLYIRRVQAVQADSKPLWASYEMPLCTLLLALGILSKPTCMVTPAVLLVIDGLLLRKRWIAAALELLPLFAVSGAGAIVARIAQYTETVEKAALWQRPFITADNIVFYFGKILWPARLCIDYSRTATVIMASRLVYLKWIIPVALALLALRWHTKRPMLAAGLAIFFIGFAPVCGLATFQMQNISFTTDHYLYFSMLGISLLVAWGFTLLPTPAAYSLAAILVLALGIRAHVQTGVWQDNKTLFASTIGANPNSAVARNNLAAMYMGGFRSRNDLAEPLLEEAVKIRPELPYAWANLGRVKAMLGKQDEAVANLNKSWELMERSGSVGTERSDLARDLALQFEEMDMIDEASKWAKKSEQFLPNDPQTRQVQARLKTKAATRPSTKPATRPSTAPLTPAHESASPR